MQWFARVLLVTAVGMWLVHMPADAASPVVITLQVNVAARGTPLKDLAVWVLPERGEGWRIASPPAQFSLPLPHAQHYLVHVEARNCTPEEVMVDAAFPDGAVPGGQHPLNILLERTSGEPFRYVRPSVWIQYRPELAAIGQVDANSMSMPDGMQERMTQLLHSERVPTQQVVLHIPRATVSAKRARGRIWLNELMEPCGRDDAAYQLVRGGVEHGSYIGYVRTLQGALRAIGHYADPDLLTPHGDFTFYHRNGAIESAGRYVHGMKTGVWYRYDPEGNALAERVYDPRPLAELLLEADEVPAFDGEHHLRNRSDGAGTAATRVHRVAHDARTSTTEDRSSQVPEPSVAVMEATGPDALALERLRVSASRTVEEEGRPVEYRRVVTYYGAVYHFRNGAPCSEAVYMRAIGR